MLSVRERAIKYARRNTNTAKTLLYGQTVVLNVAIEVVFLPTFHLNIGRTNTAFPPDAIVAPNQRWQNDLLGVVATFSFRVVKFGQYLFR